tara:strand:+ start:88 stop:477 length:390 start_codon:yes stop_codon:yes gene_type:complete
LFTAVVILLSKYFSRAKEKINSENIAISKDGINVKIPNEIIYFLFAIEPLTFILFFIEFLISIKIKIKNINKNKILRNNNNWRFFSFNSKKLLSINVKNVIKDRIIVRKNIMIINKFLFKNASINYEYI